MILSCYVNKMAKNSITAETGGPITNNNIPKPCIRAVKNPDTTHAIARANLAVTMTAHIRLHITKVITRVHTVYRVAVITMAHIEYLENPEEAKT